MDELKEIERLKRELLRTCEDLAAMAAIVTQSSMYKRQQNRALRLAEAAERRADQLRAELEGHPT